MNVSKILLVCASFIVSTVGVAYPSNTRMGYANCQSCHVSPTGGGVLTPYGQMTSEEFLSTWQYEGESKFLHGAVDLPDWLQVGGDTRYISIDTYTPTTKLHRNFTMQSDLEVAVEVIPKLKLVASAGYYGEQRIFEHRRNYALINFNDNISLRAGRFFPAFGIMLPDHTAVTRAGLGWGQGAETYNAEVSLKGEVGEFYLTGVFGHEGRMFFSSGHGYEPTTPDENGTAARAALYIGKASQIGVSYYGARIRPDVVRTVVGPYAMIGLSPEVYLLAEWDHQYQAGQQMTVAYEQLGAEIYRGIHLLGTHQYMGTKGAEVENTFSGALQWFPRPHWEFLGTYSRKLIKLEHYDSIILLGHYNL